MDLKDKFTWHQKHFESQAYNGFSKSSWKAYESIMHGFIKFLQENKHHLTPVFMNFLKNALIYI